MHIEHPSLGLWNSRPGIVLTGIWLAIIYCISFPSPALTQSLSDQELNVFRNYFTVLENGGPIDELLDRSNWPKDDGLASYLELELLFHPRYSASLPQMMDFLKRWPNHAHGKRIEKMVEVRITQTAGEHDLLAWYDRHPPVTKAGRVYYIQLLLEHQRSAEAHPLWRELYLEGISFPDDLIRITTHFERQLGTADREKRARNMILKNNREPLKQFLEGFPKNRRDYFLALDAATAGDQKMLAKYLPRLSKKEANAPELWYARLEWLRNRGSLSKVQKMVLGREGSYLNVDDRCILRFRLARSFYNDDRVSEAFELLNLNVLEKGAQLEDSLWLAAWSAHRLKKEKRALELFKLLGSEAKSDHRRAQGAWWAAELSTTREAKQMWINRAAQFPDNFYGLIALETRDGHLPRLQDPPMACAILEQPRIQEDMQRMHLLRLVGRNFYNGPEIDNLAERYRLNQEDRLCLAIKTGAYDYGLKLAREMKGSGRLYWSGLYPLPHWQPMRGWELDPALVWGIARQESMFFPRAQSSASARGLLQLMPATAEEQARKSELPPSNPGRLHDPAYNLALGQAYMKRMLKAFDGDLVLALCGYNAGPGRGKTWSDRRRTESTLTFIENIPFNETKNYVKLVIGGVVYYQLRLHGQGSILSLIDRGEPGPGKLMM
ncbi:MAG: lytic transglycosylase domain-containing protein [Magnetococcales bacterium]|nr:lytic transglycosylase domain-containing protein [Magnetococcales bacterium]MBF0151003.1 lytic transglycosylase domain-containing protein [Magnetococcales bacterium]